MAERSREAREGGIATPVPVGGDGLEIVALTHDEEDAR
jgi:hypothetical protein